MTTHTAETEQVYIQPMPSTFKRMIYLFLAGAMIAGGIYVLRLAGGDETNPNAPMGAMDAQSSAETGMIEYRDSDGDLWFCDGEISVNTCTIKELPVPDSVYEGSGWENWGYRTEAEAETNCNNGGTVQPLWKQYQIIGYSCVIEIGG